MMKIRAIPFEKVMGGGCLVRQKKVRGVVWESFEYHCGVVCKKVRYLCGVPQEKNVAGWSEKPTPDTPH